MILAFMAGAFLCMSRRGEVRNTGNFKLFVLSSANMAGLGQIRARLKNMEKV